MNTVSGPAPDLWRNLPEPAYTRLFAAEATLTETLAALADPAAPGLVCLEGPSGIGKAALAHACAARLAAQAAPPFRDLVWERLQPTEPSPDRPGLAPPVSTLDNLLDALALQLGFVELVKLALPQKTAALLARLRSAPYLVVVENLDAADDRVGLAAALRAMANPTRFLLLTGTGASLEGAARVRATGLDAEAAGAFLRYQTTQRGLEALPAACADEVQALQAAAAGNPLALQVLAGLAATLPPGRLAGELRAQAVPKDEAFTWLFHKAWATLLPEARQLLVRLTALPSAGGDAAAVRAISPLSDEAHPAALETLTRLALIERGPTTYRLHRLTRAFVETEAQLEQPGELHAAVGAMGRYAAAALQSLGDTPVREVDRGRWLEVLETCLKHGEPSDIVVTLVLALHPQMVAAGVWRLWHSYVGRVVELARRQPAPGVLGPLLICRGELLVLTGDPELAVHRFQEAWEYLTESGAEAALAWLECLWAKTSLPQGERAKARQRLTAALARAERLGQPRLLAEVHHRLGDWHAKQSQTPDALAELELAQHYAVEARWPLKEAEIWQTLALVAFKSGDWAVARERLETALALVMTRPAGVLPGHITGNLGLIYLYQGQLEAGRQELERSLALADRLGDESTICSALSNLGLVAFEQGQWATAEARFQRGLEIAERMSNIDFQISQLGCLGMVAVSEGQPAAGLRYLQSAMRIATELNRPAEQAETAIWLGEAHALTHDLAAALEWSARALTMAETIGHQALGAQIRLRRGAWLRAAGRLPEAHACLEAARADATSGWDAHPLRILAELTRVHLDAGTAELAGTLAEMARLDERTADPRLHVVYHGLLAEVALARGDEARFRSEFGAALRMARSADNDWLRKLERELQANLQARLEPLAPAARAEAERLILSPPASN